MHSFVTAILLWLTRFDGLGTDTETDPPSAEPCEASEADGSEGRTVVGADDSGEAELAENFDEYRLSELRGDSPLHSSRNRLKPSWRNDSVGLSPLADSRDPHWDRLSFRRPAYRSVGVFVIRS